MNISVFPFVCPTSNYGSEAFFQYLVESGGTKDSLVIQWSEYPIGFLLNDHVYHFEIEWLQTEEGRKKISEQLPKFLERELKSEDRVIFIYTDLNQDEIQPIIDVFEAADYERGVTIFIFCDE